MTTPKHLAQDIRNAYDWHDREALENTLRRMQAGVPVDHVLVGDSTPGGPGDIWVSRATLLQCGEQEVRRMVRRIYTAAYAARERKKR